jgi:hypothetical protein
MFRGYAPFVERDYREVVNKVGGRQRREKVALVIGECYAPGFMDGIFLSGGDNGRDYYVGVERFWPLCMGVRSSW